MTERTARLSAFATAFLLVASVAILYVTSNPGLKGSAAKAEFTDAYPLLEGMHVRVYGSIAGSVREIELTERGTALVTMQLNEGIELPRSDASAAIRQQDITGDSYVSLSLGEDSEPLGDEIIPTNRTLVAPRLDDLLNTLDEPVREGLRLVLVELGTALDRRGDDLNRAALHIRPALRAANQVAGELAAQNNVLRDLIVDAEAVTSQAAGETDEIEGLIDGLAGTTAATAQHAAGLDAGLERAAETAVAARGTLARFRRLTYDATPLAQSLARVVPDLVESAPLVQPFVENSTVALRNLDPTLKLFIRVMRASEPTLEAASGSRPLTGVFDLAAGVGDLLTALLGEEKFIRSLFGADGYGRGPRSADDVGLGAIAIELGTQLGYEGNDPARRFLRAMAVPSCEMFGVPIAPGCLADYLSASAPQPRGVEAADQPAAPDAPTDAPAEHPDRGDGQPAAQPEFPGPNGVGVPGLPDLPQLPGLPGVGGQLPGNVNDLLDFLLGP